MTSWFVRWLHKSKKPRSARGKPILKIIPEFETLENRELLSSLVT